ncbi:MAG: prepilin-type N-terminal cleavage/methylation domain-containing protein [Methylococcaceae bacterium]|nr:prepilin-type N-terminal cleavage/methylation domain-containing protein [Methylococcaceae bacterium]
MKNQKQQGFTLIELIMVIVTLGILAAVAIPKFANTQAAARAATLQGTFGALNSAMSIVYSQALMSNQLNGTVAVPVNVNVLGGVVPTAFGYPVATSAAVQQALNLTIGNFTIAGAGPITIDMIGATTPATCRITYTSAVSIAVPATATILTAGC